MNRFRLGNPWVSTLILLFLTLLIGLLVVFLPLNAIECKIVLDTQNLAQKTVGIQVFQVATYLGDFYLWVVFGSVYLLYVYVKSRSHLGSAIEIAVFFVATTALTYFTKMVFARPRPDCPGLNTYSSDILSSFSYPSGHVSRVTGGFLILSGKSRIKRVLAAFAIFAVSLSRIALGAHYPTDVLGGIFLSLGAQQLANFALSFFTMHVTLRRMNQGRMT
jgi:membrane-associated phospholipid phosphatase